MFSFTFMFLAVLVWFGFGSCLIDLRIGLFVYLLAEWSAALFGSIWLFLCLLARLAVFFIFTVCLLLFPWAVIVSACYRCSPTYFLLFIYMYQHACVLTPPPPPPPPPLSLPSVCLSVGLSACLSTCLSVRLSVCLSVCQSVSVSHPHLPPFPLSLPLFVPLFLYSIPPSPCVLCPLLGLFVCLFFALFSFVFCFVFFVFFVVVLFCFLSFFFIGFLILHVRALSACNILLIFGFFTPRTGFKCM